ncbi:unnamed protein product [Menidia menidia]|uniref:(Atlantic silverside) hypothetical protein n=1 Tax=Menidia menidia TaxID=238744 RepID=A0A8S4APD1_9TELE|nr:unnamed protein product [Menidia menidia]
MTRVCWGAASRARRPCRRPRLPSPPP